MFEKKNGREDSQCLPSGPAFLVKMLEGEVKKLVT